MCVTKTTHKWNITAAVGTLGKELVSKDRNVRPSAPQTIWILYGPTLAAYPDEAERWMHEQFTNAGVAVAGN